MGRASFLPERRPMTAAGALPADLTVAGADKHAGPACIHSAIMNEDFSRPENRLEQSPRRPC
jgi:hypothetical protein